MAAFPNSSCSALMAEHQSPQIKGLVMSKGKSLPLTVVVLCVISKEFTLYITEVRHIWTSEMVLRLDSG